MIEMFLLLCLLILLVYIFYANSYFLLIVWWDGNRFSEYVMFRFREGFDSVPI